MQILEQTLRGSWREKAHWASSVTLSPRGGWQILAAGPQGSLVVELGRDEPDARLTRFVAAQPRTLGTLARAGTRVDYVDLRYRNGFAARVPEFREKRASPPPKRDLRDSAW